jgi:hypothetical protein
MVELWPVTPAGAGSTPVFPELRKRDMHNEKCSLAINFSKHNILCTNDSDHIGKHMIFCHGVQCL